MCSMIISYFDCMVCDNYLVCRGICERYRSDKKRYVQGTKRCTSCDVYLLTQSLLCPCCNIALRAKRKSKLTLRT